MLVTDRHQTGGRDLVEVVAAAARGGVELVQVREKDLPDDVLLALVLRLRTALPPAARVVVNGRPAVARAAGVGLHLAAAAPPPPERPPGLYGRAAHDEDEAHRARAERVDYILLGTIFPTGSKPGLPGSGPGLIQRVSRLVAPTPLLAIGGITVTNARSTLAAGAHGIAVCSAILTARDPRLAALALAAALAPA
jgi:thiamine-phosphate pyrophosphorylase